MKVLKNLLKELKQKEQDEFDQPDPILKDLNESVAESSKQPQNPIPAEPHWAVAGDEAFAQFLEEAEKEAPEKVAALNAELDAAAENKD